MIFTRKKFRLIGARARIKKIFHILVDLIPEFSVPADLEILPDYLDYLLTLNPEAKSFQFDGPELEQLEQFRQQLVRAIPEDVQRRKEAYPTEERRQVAKVMLDLRHFLAEKIQQPIKESSLIILERDLPPTEPLDWPKEIVVAIDHLRSPYNVGAVVRTMECVGLHRLISIGYTPRLDSKQVKRSAMSCETEMEVEYVEDGVEAVKKLKDDGFQIYTLETIVPSTSVFEFQPLLQSAEKIALVIGNEEMGVDETIIAISDQLIHIPTFGKKNSLNVSIAFSITIYQFWAAIFGGAS
ncbi:MAG: RNA methyltransferase [bacterium]|nr:RNA methyltransferase [bacterium]